MAEEKTKKANWFRYKSNQRLLLYVSIALIGSILADFTEIATKIYKEEVILWITWVIVGLKSTMQGLITWRAYIDESPANGGSKTTTIRPS